MSVNIEVVLLSAALTFLFAFSYFNKRFEREEKEHEKYQALLVMEWDYWNNIPEVTLGGNMSHKDVCILLCLIGCDLDITNRNYTGLLFFSFFLNMMRFGDKVPVVCCFSTEALAEKGEKHYGKTKDQA